MIKTATKALAAAFALFSLCSTSYAQNTTSNTQTTEAQLVNDAQNRIATVMNSAMVAVNEKAQDFNSHLATINAVRPLELQNLDSAHLETSIPEVMRFTKYLSDFGASTDALGRSLEDSLFVLRQTFPLAAADGSLKEFEESFGADRKAFDGYVTALRRVYDQVLNVLLFMQRAPHKCGTQLEFTTKDDADRYNKFMQMLNVAQQDMAKASAESRKATEASNKTIERINKKQNGK